MADWASGYVTEVPYTQGYYRELSPLAIRFALNCAGFRAPPATGFSYCELGFGQGLSLNVHAAAHPDSVFHGADINPMHVCAAQAMAAASGANVALHEASFEEMLAREDLPDFDFITLHGIWTWVSAENQALLVQFFRKHLKPGGVVYLSYNCLPGWSAGGPLRHLMTQYAASAMPQGSGVLPRMDAALSFASKVADLDLGYFAGAKALKDKLEGMKRQSRNYLVHEYMNADWRLMYFSDVAKALSEAKLDFAGSAAVSEQLDGLRIPGPGIELLRDIQDPILRETTRDYLVNQQFRRDLFVRGAERLSGVEQKQLLESYVVALVRPAAALAAVTTPRHGVPAALRTALIDYLSTRGSASLGDLTQACPTHPPALVRQVVMVLLGANELALVGHQGSDEESVQRRQRAASACQALNAYWGQRVGTGKESSYLASPYTQGAVQIGALSQLLASVCAQRHARGAPIEAKALADAAWAHLSGLGQRVVRAGKTCETPAENEAALLAIAEEFLGHEYGLMRDLGLLPN